MHVYRQPGQTAHSCQMVNINDNNNNNNTAYCINFMFLSMIHTCLCRLRRYRDGVELQLIDEEESPNHGPLMYSAVTPATGAGTTAGEGGGSASNARFRTNAARNAPKYARVKALAAKDGGGNGGGSNDATVLVVRRLTRFDSGRYECRVRNSVGAANSSNFANVRVQCECSKIETCRAVSIE